MGKVYSALIWLSGVAVAMSWVLAYAPPARGAESGAEIHARLHTFDRPEDALKPGYNVALDELRQYLDANPDPELEAAWEAHAGMRSFWSGQRDLAIQQFENSLMVLDAEPANKDAQRTKLWLSDARVLSGEPIKAIAAVRSLYDGGLKAENQTEEHFFSALMMSNALSAIGEHQEALDALYQYYPLPKHLQTSDNVPRLHFYIAQIHRRLGGYETAADFYAAALNWQLANPDIGSLHHRSVFSRLLGEMKRELGELEEAKRYLEDAVVSAEAGSVPEQLSLAKVELAAVALAQGAVDEAFTIAQEAEAVIADAQNSLALADLYQLLGRIELARENPYSAKQYLESALEEFAKVGSEEQQAITNQLLASAQWDSGDWSVAFDTLDAAMNQFRDAAEQREVSRVSQLRGLFESERVADQNRLLEKENALAELRVQRQTTLTMFAVVASGALLFMLLSAVYILYRQRRYQQQLQRLADTDSLTGLLNHRSIFSVGNELASRAWYESTPLSVIAADIDFFKRINDNFGHPVGDMTLQRVAAGLSSGLREGDFAGRTGGEEFLLVLPGARQDGAAQVAERIRQAIESGMDLGDEEMPDVTISVGVAELIETHGKFSELAKLADERLYAAKASGRNKVVSGARGEMPVAV